MGGISVLLLLIAFLYGREYVEMLFMMQSEAVSTFSFLLAINVVKHHFSSPIKTKAL